MRKKISYLGFEPRTPGREPGILTVRLIGFVKIIEKIIVYKELKKIIINKKLFIINNIINILNYIILFY